MQLFLLSFLVFLLAMAGIGVGLLTGRGAPRGSCGGLNLPDGTRLECGGCTGRQRCRRDGGHRAGGPIAAGRPE